MKKGQTLWTRDELILAINLYCKLPFGKLHSRNPEIINLAHLIGRSENSVALKLVNFASLDPSLNARGIKGASNASKLDAEIWNEFYNNWEDRAYESEKLLAKFEKKPIEQLVDLEDIEIKEGKEKERLVKTRVNQHFFRAMVLASYNFKCCITGIKNTELLVASHIVPWAVDKDNRMNPRNGLCLNALHDKAFDNYLITITPDYKVLLAKRLKTELKKEAFGEMFLAFENAPIKLPRKFLPDALFLERHNEVFEKRN
ncbi:MAG TPA: HNH endonuclease [Chitinophagales bacterium]|nr:HNH endonuclease [Chitinophagales bacterium]